MLLVFSIHGGIKEKLILKINAHQSIEKEKKENETYIFPPFV